MRGNTKTRPSGEKIRINIYTECKKLNMNWGRRVNTVDRIATASDGGCRQRSPQAGWGGTSTFWIKYAVWNTECFSMSNNPQPFLSSTVMNQPLSMCNRLSQFGLPVNALHSAGVQMDWSCIPFHSPFSSKSVLTDTFRCLCYPEY